ncbi:MAG: hypothetical protein JOS17DRAFT_797580 [Linnemannia elongata]|nr:MAG: hypothetical protein JOS17DRAFT_797580 [Linnemannia elongata]
MTVKSMAPTIPLNVAQRTTVTLSNLSAEIILQGTGYLSGNVTHSCALFNKSLSQSFAPRLWHDLDPSRCYPKRASISRIGRFDLFKSCTIDTGAFLTDGQVIQSLKASMSSD